MCSSDLGRVAKTYLKKGSTCYLEGAMQTRKWTDQSGQDKYTTEVVLQRFRGELVLLGGRGDGGGSGGGSFSYGNQDRGGGNQFGGSSGGGSSGGGRSAPSAFDSDLDDDVPF